jgi:hypothetical protein
VNAGPGKSSTANREPAHWQVSLSGFFAKLWVEVSIGVLVLISVGLTLLEFALA